MDTDPTNPAGEGDTEFSTAEASEGVDSQVQSDDDQKFDDDGNPIEEPSEDEEVELGDLKLKVPKDQAQKVRDGWLRQDDYTRKTQGLAEERKAIEAERAVIQQSSEGELTAFAQMQNFGAQVASLDQTAQQYGGWAAWAREDPFAANEAHMARTELDRARQTASYYFANARQQRLSMDQQRTATAIEQGRTAIAKAISGYNDDMKAKLTDYAVEKGVPREVLADMESDPAAVKIMHDAYQWSQHQKKTTAADRHLQAQTSTPAATVGARAAPPQGLDDRLGTEEWVKRRNAQVRKRA